MKNTILSAAILSAVLLTFASGSAFAQHEMHHPDVTAAQAQSAPQTAQPSTSGDSMGKMNMGKMNASPDGMKDGAMKDGATKDAAMKDDGMMGGGMMSKMMDREKQTSDVVAKLMSSMDAMQNEKSAATLKQKMTEHRALLEQLKTLISQPKCEMMDKMSSMMNSGMMNKDAQAPAK